ncbi:MAG: C_GCAxxG_C_C family protein [Dehalococcoidales bacterium]|nr:C_GCAxxG_C_C family protein [Dehalococcoidales bacterium]
MDDILNKAFSKAKQHEMESGDCAQCSLSGIFEALNIENEDVIKAATGLADGVGLTGDGHCGALSGGTMAISYLFGRSKADFGDMNKVLRACILSKQLHDQFIEKYGTCRCADIQKKLVGRFYNLYDPAEMEAALKVGMADKCSTLVGEVARMATKIVLEEREKETLESRKSDK